MATIDGIASVVLENVSPELKPKEGSYYYKKHSEHAGFTEAVAKAQSKAPRRMQEIKADDVTEAIEVPMGKIQEAEVGEAEAEAQMEKEDQEMLEHEEKAHE